MRAGSTVASAVLILLLLVASPSVRAGVYGTTGAARNRSRYALRHRFRTATNTHPDVDFIGLAGHAVGMIIISIVLGQQSYRP